jgi:hypothetical protein
MMHISLQEIADGRLSPARLAALLQGSTYATLLVEYGRTVVPLRELAQVFLGMSPERASSMAKRGVLELPAFKTGGRSSPWMIHLYDLAHHIDAARIGAGSQHVVEEAEA